VLVGVLRRVRAAGVGGIAFASAASGEQANASGQRWWYVDDVFSGCGQLLGDAAAEGLGSFDGELAIWPLLRPGREFGEGCGVDGEAAAAQLRRGGVDGGRGQRRFVRIDPDGDHSRWAPNVAARGVRRGGHPDLQSSHASVEPHHGGRRQTWHAPNKPTRRAAGILADLCPPAPLDARAADPAPGNGFNKSGFWAD
jgi:hypothetical protein